MTTAAVLLAQADPRLSDVDRLVVYTMDGWDGTDPPTLDGLCHLLGGIPRQHVFAAVARLEDWTYLPWGQIR